jgi:hypothetical protein
VGATSKSPCTWTESAVNAGLATASSGFAVPSSIWENSSPGLPGTGEAEAARPVLRDSRKEFLMPSSKSLTAFVTAALIAASLGPVACIIDSCFVAGTQVATPAGPRAIESLAVGDEVLSFSLETREIVTRRVRAILRDKSSEVRRIATEKSAFIGVTRAHPIYVASRGDYVKAENIAAGDALLALSGTSVHEAVITGIEASEHEAADIEVFNLSIEGPEHNYFADGFLVHNKEPPGTPLCASAQIVFGKGAWVDEDTFELPLTIAGAVGLPSATAWAADTKEGTDAIVTRRDATHFTVTFDAKHNGQYDVRVYARSTQGDAESCAVHGSVIVVTDESPDAGSDAARD